MPSLFNAGLRPLWPRAVAAAAVAALTMVLIATRVFTHFPEVRAKIVRTAVAADTSAISLTLPTDVRLDSRSGTFAVIWRVRNASTAPATFALAIDGRHVCRREVPAGRVARLDCAVTTSWSAARPTAVAISGPAPPWSLEYLEIATHHGGSRRIQRVLVVPAEVDHPKPRVFWTVLSGALVALLMVMPPISFERRWQRGIHRAAGGLIAVAIAVTLTSAWLTNFKVIISLAACAMWLSVLLLPRLRFVAAYAGRHWLATRVARQAALTVAVAAVVCASYVGVTSLSLQGFYEGNYSGFLHIARSSFDSHPLLRDRTDIREGLYLEDGGGYDGQFAYFIAFDPLLLAFRERPQEYGRFIDAPPYRYGRIGFPLLTKLVSFNQAALYPKVMVWLILAGVIATSVALAMIARHHQASPAWGLATLLVPGFWTSLQYGLPEPIAAAFLLWGLFSVMTRRVLLGAFLMAGSLLIRETGALLIVIVAIAMSARERRGDALRMGLIAFAPYAAWRLYIGSALYPAWGWEAFFYNPRIHGVPLGGLVDLMHSLARGDYGNGVPILVRAAFWFALLLPFAVALSVCLAVRTRSAFAIAAALSGLIAMCLGFERMWEHIANVTRGTFEPFLLLALALATAAPQPRWLQALAVVLGAACVLYMLNADLFATVLQDALFGGFR